MHSERKVYRYVEEKNNIWWFWITSLFLFSDILLRPFFPRRNVNERRVFSKHAVILIAFFSLGSRCHHLCGRHVQLPGLPCLCATTLALWWWEGLSEWKWWALHSRLWYGHLWGCMWRKAAEHLQTFASALLTVSHCPSLSQSLDSQVVSELTRWDVVITVVQRPL